MKMVLAKIWYFFYFGGAYWSAVSSHDDGGNVGTRGLLSYIDTTHESGGTPCQHSDQGRVLRFAFSRLVRFAAPWR